MQYILKVYHCHLIHTSHPQLNLSAVCPHNIYHVTGWIFSHALKTSVRLVGSVATSYTTSRVISFTAVHRFRSRLIYSEIKLCVI